MFDSSVRPLLAKTLPTPEPFVCRTLRSAGMGESMVAETVEGDLKPLMSQGLDVGYCARPGQVDVRLSAWGAKANELVNEAVGSVRAHLKNLIYTESDEEVEEVLVRLLITMKKTVAVAESCTGGLIAHRLTNVPGASAVLMGGLVVYSNQSKQELLGISAATLEAHGAVSEPVAREMAEAARKRLGTDFAISVTGIAGPSGGTPEKPVGTVFIGLADGLTTTVKKYLNPFDRETFKQVTAQRALELLRTHPALKSA
jgi:nicotinamide-nucleotide amidase